MRVTSMGLALWLFAATALAQQHEGEPAAFPVERLRPALTRDGIIDVESGSVGGHLSYDISLWGSYALNPLTLSRRNDDGTVERAGVLVGHRFGASLVGSLSLFEWVEIGAELPVIVFQSRGELPAVADATLRDLSALGIGDLRVAPKIRILRREEQFVDLAIIPAFTAWTAFPKDAYLGEKSLTFVPELALSTSIVGVKLGANLAARFRPESRFLGLNVTHELVYRAGVGYDLRETLKLPFDVNASVNGATALLAPLVLGNLNQNPLEVMGAGAWDFWGPFQLFGGVGVGLIAGFGTPDLRVFAGLRYGQREIDRDGDGILDKDDACRDEPEDKDGFEDSDGCPDPDNDADGIADVSDRCPDIPGVPEEQGCPEDDRDGDGLKNDEDSCPDTPEDADGYEDGDGCPDLDNDNDGIPDTTDKCVNDPEDKDGFADDDGCPEDDNDADGFKDAEDQCPNEAEDKDGYRDNDGCPEPDNDEDGILDNDDECPDQPEDMDQDRDEDGCPEDTKVVVTRSKVEILETVHFEVDKATIKAESFALLRDVAKAIQALPPEARVRIEGHTDAEGSDGYNLLLSQRRADAVRQFLIKEGIAAKRLDAKGFGETDPIATNDTPEGRAKNRRVIFTILAGG